MIPPWHDRGQAAFEHRTDGISAMRLQRHSPMRLACSVVLIAASLSACTTARNTRGYIFNDQVVDSLAEGVDNRRSVFDSLGNPSLTSAFGTETWYYVSRETVTEGFLKERPISQKIVAIAFTDGGEVESITRYDLSKAKNISPHPDETPIRGKTLGFFEELLRGIGRVGPGGPGGPGGRRGPPGT